ncbi:MULTISPECIES: M20/M25/M40 family metallo-hydrolase [Enorma]|uniref:M20/M25/M40 family metallo-hydrolase n=1 Tax=Enorma TaxID=1472762 RepID=UPI00034D9E5A|nr:MULTISPECIES: M20/M25/M40 family metallo-hydrolase [Enorma]
MHAKMLMKGAAAAAAVGIGSVAGFCAVRAARMKPARPAGAPLDAGVYHADDDAVKRFQELLRVPTISRDDPKLVDRKPFTRWVPTLRRLYPLTFAACELHMIDEFGMLMRWPGTNPALDPIVMMAHHDVVPVDGQHWEHDPFGAEIIDGEIWARGSLDTKCIIGAFFEAAEYLIGRGYQPPRDVWFFSSNAEEVSGPAARDAVAWLRDHGIHPAMVLDEGGAVAGDTPLGVKVPVAMVGVSEKGHVDLTVTARADGGHASTPARTDAPLLLARVCDRIASNPGMPCFTEALDATLAELASRSSMLYRLVFSNLWLTRPLVAKIMASNGETAAMLRTTYALTQLEGSPAHNVLPPVARANFNVRVAPFETVDDAVARARALAVEECLASGVSPDHVTVEIAQAVPYTEPAPISPFENDAAFDYLHRCVSGVYPEAGFAPYVQNSCTDSREFNAICEHVYRFCGFEYSAEARALIHAENERIGVDVYKRGIGFYVAFLANLGQLEM